MGSRSPDERIDRSKLAACVAAARRSLLDRDPGPDDPVDLTLLSASLGAITGFPGIYNDCALVPLRAALERLGAAGFAAVLSKHQGDLLILDLAQALSQRHGNYHRRELMAFQEVVGDLYDGFLSAEDRRGLNRPERRVPAPLVKWGRPDIGPYALGADQMAALGVGCGIVSLPGAVARADGLFAWGVLPHETAGHGIVGADPGLLGQLAEAVSSALSADLRPKKSKPSATEDELLTLVDHWTFTLDEAAADVLGVLNMGPAGAIAGLILLRAAYGGARRDPAMLEAHMLGRHPVPVLRVPLMAEVLRRTRFGRSNSADGWDTRAALLLDREADELAGEAGVRIGDRQISWDLARQSARTVAGVIATARVAALGWASLAAVQSWRDRDERIVRMLRGVLTDKDDESAARLVDGGFYGAHVVAAAVLEALADPERIPDLHYDMVAALALMHEANPSWGPLSVLHPSDLTPRRAGGIPRLTAFAGGIPRLTVLADIMLGSGNQTPPATGGIPPMGGGRATPGIPRMFGMLAAGPRVYASGIQELPDEHCCYPVEGSGVQA